jgi:Flp pilus assembly protein TadD
VLAVLALGGIWRGRGRAIRVFGASWFFVAYLPVSNIVRLNATVAEHWLYLPSVGFFMFLAGCALGLNLWQRKVAMVLTFVAAAALSTRSYQRSTDWVTPETFYRRTIAAGGTSARTGLNLAQIYAERGDYKEAERMCRKVLEFASDYPLAKNNLASAISHQGRREEAERLFAEIDRESKNSRKEYPRTWIGVLNLARLRFSAGDSEFCLQILERARLDYPEVWEIVSFQSEVLRQKRGPDAALQVVDEFARANWWHHGAALALGRLYAQRDDAARAEAELRRASRLDVHDIEALGLLTAIKVRQNRLAEALQLQRRAVGRQPDEPRQYILLSEILEKMGRSDEARIALAKATQLRSFAETDSSAN